MSRAVLQPITALLCPACGGPLTDRAARRCGFCGVALIVPDDGHGAALAGDAVGLRTELARLRDRLRADPSRAESHRRLGSIYEALGLWDDAVRALTVAVGLAPEDTGTRLGLATLLASRSAAGVPDAFPAAMRHVRQLLVLAPDSTDARLLLARLQTQRGDFDAARATLGRILELPGDEVRRRAAWVTLAEAAARERRGDRTGAVAGWRLAAVDAPDLARTAIVGFLDRNAPDNRVTSRTRSGRPSDQSSRRQTPRLRPIPAAIAAALIALIALIAGPTWMIGVAIALVVLVALLWLRRADRRRDAWTLARRHDPSASLDRLLGVATRVATVVDALAHARRRDWADNLAVEIAEPCQTRLAVVDDRSRAVRWPVPCTLPERAG